MSFAFGLQFQQASLRLMLDDEAFCSLACKHFQANYFENAALSWTFVRIKDYFDSYMRPPTSLVLYEELRKLDPLMASQYQPTVDIIHQSVPAEAEYIRKNVVDFVQRNIFVDRFDYARQLYNKGDVDAAYDYWQRGAAEMGQVGLDEVERSFFFDEFEERDRKRKLRETQRDQYNFSTGIPDLDVFLNGGLSIGELGCWIAFQKIGKSMILLWLAFWAVRALNVKVLVTVHEGNLDYWQARLDAIFAHAFVTNVARGELTPEMHRDLVEEYRMMRGMLVLRGYTKASGENRESWNATAADLDRELVDLKQRFGFVPRMLVVDYADLLRSRYDAESEKAHQTAAYRDLKTMTGRDNGYAIWTACQAQRKPDQADVDPSFFVRDNNIGDDINKARICDFYGSINRTVRETEEETARLLALDYRGGEKRHTVIDVRTDYKHGRFIRSPVRVYPEAAPPPPMAAPTIPGIPGIPAP